MTEKQVRTLLERRTNTYRTRLQYTAKRLHHAINRDDQTRANRWRKKMNLALSLLTETGRQLYGAQYNRLDG